MQPSTRKYYSGITVFKLVGSVLVLLGHIKLPETYAQLAQHLIGLEQMMAFTVPCFYIVSGFLAYKGWAHTAHPGRYLRRYLLWIGAAYGLFFVYYLATTVVPGWVASYQAGQWSGQQLKPLFEIVFVYGPSPALWFIPPLVFGVVVAYWFERRGRLGLGIGLTAVGYVLAQLDTGTLRVLVEWLGGSPWVYHFRHARLLELLLSSYLGVGLPSVLLGVWAAGHEAAFRQLRGRRLAGVAVLMLGAEVGFLSAVLPGAYTYRMVFSVLPVSLLLFYGVLRLRLDGIRRYHVLINRFSIVAYFLHIPLIGLNAHLLGTTMGHLSPWQALGCAVLTMGQAAGLTALLSAVLNRRSAPVAEPDALAGPAAEHPPIR